MRLGLSGGMLLRSLVWTAVCAASAARAQSVTPLAPANITPVPHIGGVGAQVASVSGDGRRIALFRQVGVAEEFLVLDTRSGAVLFARTVEPLNQIFLRDILLTPDGGSVVFGEVSAAHPGTRRYLARDLQTGTTRLLGEAPVHTYLLATSAGARVVAVNTLRYPGLMTVFRGSGSPLEIIDTCAGPASVPLFGPTLLSGDGKTLVFTRAWNAPQGGEMASTVVVNTDSGALRCLSPTALPTMRSSIGPMHLNSDGGVLTDPSTLPASGPGTGQLRQLPDDTRQPTLPSFWRSRPVATSDDGRVLLIAGSPTAHSYEGLYVVDTLRNEVTSVVTPDALGHGSSLAHALLSSDGTTVVFSLFTAQPLSHTSYVARLDLDRDEMQDAWETTFGLNPADPADAVLDSDSDGRTNAQEHANGTHPLGTPVRYFAEGANGSFFATSLALFNPSSTAVTANVRFLGPDGATRSMPVHVPARGPAYLDADQVNLGFTEFSTVVESPTPVVAERRMTWHRAQVYGSHNGTGVAAPATTWHFAEGATIAGLQTFFLLQNPGDAAVTATMRYLLAAGGTEVRSHVVPARSRLTVWANQEGTPLDAAEFATTVLGDAPIVVERAMYSDAPGEPFSAGSVTSGVTTPATSWFFAEGATGSFFDTYLLLANPGAVAATVDVDFLRAHDVRDISTAYPVARQYVLPPHSRRTIWVAQEDPNLRDTQVGARVTSDAPVIAERTMWWPGPTSATWRENHAEVGVTTSGQLWAVADMQVDAAADGWDTFVMIATTRQQLARVRVDVACQDGTTATRDISISVHRTTLWMRHEFPATVGRRCAATIESLLTRITLSPTVAPVRTPLVVETATYFGADFRAGGATLATRLRDPQE